VAYQTQKIMILRYTLLSILIVFGFNTKAQNPFGFELSDGSKTVELPFRKVSNLMIVPIKINGNGPFDFIFDTGSESGLIFEKSIIPDYNLENARKIPVYAKDGEKLTELIVANRLTVTLNGVHGIDQTMLVLKEDIMDVHNVLGSNIYGVLGSEIFNRFVVEVDYVEQIIKLHDPSSFKKPQNYKAVQLEINNFRPYVTVKLGQKGTKQFKAKLLVDSGASSAMFLDESNNENIPLPKRTIEISLGTGLAGVIEGKIGRVHKMKIGGYRFSNITTSYPTEWSIGSDNETIIDKSNIRHGTLGADLLSRFDVIFDYSNETMYLKKNEHFSNDFVFNTVGLNVMAMGLDLNNYVVSDIIQDSQAHKAGIKIGDEIISLNGKPAFFYSLTDVNNMLRDKPGTLLTLILRRDKELIKKTIRQKRVL
jgi:predicted aspartyl protease